MPTFVEPARATPLVALSLARCLRSSRSGRRSKEMWCAPTGRRSRAGIRPAGRDAAAEALEVLPHAAHALHVVFSCASFFGACPRPPVQREDVEDHARAVDDAQHLSSSSSTRCWLGESSVLGDDDLGLELLGQFLELLELAAAHVGRGWIVARCSSTLRRCRPARCAAARASRRARVSLLGHPARTRRRATACSGCVSHSIICRVLPHGSTSVGRAATRCPAPLITQIACDSAVADSTARPPSRA